MNFEKGPEFRVIGNAPEEKKEEFLTAFERIFHGEHLDALSPETREIIETHDIEKSKEHKRVLEDADAETSRLMEECGLEAFTIPEENFHILPEEQYLKLFEDSFAVTNRFQYITFNEKRSHHPIAFGLSAFHEMLHLKSHQSFEYSKNNDPERSADYLYNPYRWGVKTYSSQKKIEDSNWEVDEVHFRGLDEAIIVDQEKKYATKLYQKPEMREARELFESEKIQQQVRERSQEEGEPVDEYYVLDEREQDRGIRPYKYGYPKEREVYDYVVEQIRKSQSQAGNEIPSEDVKTMFLKSNFTGQLLPIARAVERAFGKGSFRILGEMDPSKENAEEIYDKLILMRKDIEAN